MTGRHNRSILRGNAVLVVVAIVSFAVWGFAGFMMFGPIAGAVVAIGMPALTVYAVHESRTQR